MIPFEDVPWDEDEDGARHSPFDFRLSDDVSEDELFDLDDLPFFDGFDGDPDD
jgi:hypothetical protein